MRGCKAFVVPQGPLWSRPLRARAAHLTAMQMVSSPLWGSAGDQPHAVRGGRGLAVLPSCPARSLPTPWAPQGRPLPQRWGITEARGLRAWREGTWDPGEGTWDPSLMETLNRVNSGEVPSPAPDFANPVALSPHDRVQGAVRRTGRASPVPAVSHPSPLEVFSSAGILS